MQWFAGPARLMRRFYYFASTTPGKLFGVTVILTVALAAVAGSSDAGCAGSAGEVTAAV